MTTRSTGAPTLNMPKGPLFLHYATAECRPLGIWSLKVKKLEAFSQLSENKSYTQIWECDSAKTINLCSDP
jgi:hypothetical protein